jgi:hypothetical protein
MPAIPNNSTTQQVYDFVVNHLRRQGGPAVDASGTCLYRAARNYKCGVGCLITDEEYSPDIEGTDIETLSEGPDSALPVFFLRHNELLLDMQNIHDAQAHHLYDLSTGHKVFNTDKLEAALQQCAMAFDLTYKEPPSATNNESK